LKKFINNMDKILIIMDKTDLLILEELKKNSRQPVRDIAKKTRIRPSTVHLRIKKLVKDNIIEKFTVKLDNGKTEENFIVFILVSTTKNIPNIFFSNTHIKEVFGITGEYDLIMKCKFKDILDFNKFVLGFREYPQINKTVTMVGTLTLKEEI
jgi:DNA-binding Lrp family transcriptional regulator